MGESDPIQRCKQLVASNDMLTHDIQILNDALLAELHRSRQREETIVTLSSNLNGLNGELEHLRAAYNNQLTQTQKTEALVEQLSSPCHVSVGTAADVDELRKEILLLKKQLAWAEADRSSLEKKVVGEAPLLDEVAFLRRKVATLEEEKVLLAAEARNASNAVANTQPVVSSPNGEYIKNVYSQLEEKCKEVTRLNSRATSLQQELHERDAALKALLTTHETAQLRFSSLEETLRSEVRHAQAKEVAMGERLAETANNLTVRVGELDVLREKLGELEVALAAEKHTRSLREEELCCKVEETSFLKHTIADAEFRARQSQEELSAALTETRDKERHHARSYSVERERLQAQYANMQRAVDTAASGEADARRALLELGEQLVAARNTIEELSNALRVEERAKVTAQCATEDARRERHEMMQELQQIARTEQERMEAAKIEALQYEERVTAMENEHRKERKASKQAATALQTALEQALTAAEIAQREGNNWKDTAARTEIALADSGRALATQRAHAEEAEAALIAELGTAKRTIEQMKSQLKGLQREVEEAREESECSRKEAIRLADDAREKNKKWRDAEDRADQAEQRARAVLEAGEGGEAQVKRLKGRCAEQVETIAAVERLLADERDRRLRVERDCSRQTSELRETIAVMGARTTELEERCTALSVSVKEADRRGAAAASAAQQVAATLRGELRTAEEALAAVRIQLTRESTLWRSLASEAEREHDDVSSQYLSNLQQLAGDREQLRREAAMAAAEIQKLQNAVLARDQELARVLRDAARCAEEVKDSAERSSAVTERSSPVGSVSESSYPPPPSSTHIPQTNLALVSGKYLHSPSISPTLNTDSESVVPPLVFGHTCNGISSVSSHVHEQTLGEIRDMEARQEVALHLHHASIARGGDMSSMTDEELQIYMENKASATTPSTSTCTPNNTLNTAQDLIVGGCISSILPMGRLDRGIEPTGYLTAAMGREADGSPTLLNQSAKTISNISSTEAFLQKRRQRGSSIVAQSSPGSYEPQDAYAFDTACTPTSVISSGNSSAGTTVSHSSSSTQSSSSRKAPGASNTASACASPLKAGSSAHVLESPQRRNANNTDLSRSPVKKGIRGNGNGGTNSSTSSPVLTAVAGSTHFPKI